jgi:hypothetical protein
VSTPVREVALSAPGWPPGLPGRRVAVVNCILKSNGHPAGATELSIDALKQIGIPR